MHPVRPMSPPSPDRALRPVHIDEGAWRRALPRATWLSSTSSFPALVVLQDALGAAVEPLLHPAADVALIRLALLELDVVVSGDVAAGERPSATSTVVARAAHALGTTVAIRVDVDVAGRAVCAVTVTFLARAPRRREDEAVIAARAADAARFAALPARFAEDIALADDAPALFARTCGNDDPVSTDLDVARMAGLPAPVVPACGVVAVVWDTIVRHVDAQHPVRRLRVSLGRPLLGGDAIRLDARGAFGPGELQVRVRRAPAATTEPNRRGASDVTADLAADTAAGVGDAADATGEDVAVAIAELA